MRPITVLGGGRFGTALAQLCAQQERPIQWWVRNAAQAEAINTTRRNPACLSGFELAPSLSATPDLACALSRSDVVLVAVPCQAVRSVLTAAAPYLTHQPVVLGSKGLESESLMTGHETGVDVLGASWASRILALSGPSFALDMMQGHPTGVVLAGQDAALAQHLAQHVLGPGLRTYWCQDVIGVEMGGALKNVVAIAAGIFSGLGAGSNTQALMITRGLGEITQMAIAKGGQPSTLLGLAGVGDMVLTCTGELSRNRLLGQMLARAGTAEKALQSLHQRAEGVVTSQSAYRLAQALNIETPLIRMVYRILHEGCLLTQAIEELSHCAPCCEAIYEKPRCG